jgi:predicted ester cyclase
MSNEQNKAVVRRFFEAFEANDAAGLNDVLAPDLVAYSHGQPGAQTRDEHVQGILFWNSAFGNTRFSIEEQIAEGDRVASRMTMQAVHNKGEFQGLAPSGRQVQSLAVTIERIRDGQIVERRVISDWMSVMHQLGLAPAAQAGD